jgi:hypothetical protein
LCLFALFDGLLGAILGVFGNFSARVGFRGIGLALLTLRLAGRRIGLANGQWNAANDFVGLLGIGIRDDLHGHVELFTLRIRGLLCQDTRSDSIECKEHRNANRHDHRAPMTAQV